MHLSPLRSPAAPVSAEQHQQSGCLVRGLFRAAAGPCTKQRATPPFLDEMWPEERCVCAAVVCVPAGRSPSSQHRRLCRCRRLWHTWLCVSFSCCVAPQGLRVSELPLYTLSHRHLLFLFRAVGRGLLLGGNGMGFLLAGRADRRRSSMCAAHLRDRSPRCMRACARRGAGSLAPASQHFMSACGARACGVPVPIFHRAAHSTWTPDTRDHCQRSH